MYHTNNGLHILVIVAPLHSCSVSKNETVPNGQEVEMEGNCQIW